MENPEQSKPVTEELSKLIDKAVNFGDKPQLPRRPARYDLLKASNPEHPLVVNYHEAQKKYNEYWLQVNPPKQPEPKPELKKLVEVDFVSLYNLFLSAYALTNGVKFDSSYNNGEPKIFAYSLMYYLFKSEKFFDSPLLNKTINQPDLKKGLLAIGGYGCGKTSIFKAFRFLFFEASRDESIMVKDVDGDEIPLVRYRKLFFAFFSVNDVVKDFEACSTHESKSRFWDIMMKGFHYYDDLTKEREASNYGKVELFQDILEGRYEKNVNTMASLNYVGGNAEATLNAMGDKYGPRVYDRIFEMFNIIELNGKSLRK